MTNEILIYEAYKQLHFYFLNKLDNLGTGFISVQRKLRKIHRAFELNTFLKAS